MLAGLLLTSTWAVAEDRTVDTSVDPLEQALISAKQTLDAAWSAAPMGFTKSLFIASSSPAYGQYSPRQTNIFSPGERLIVYAEPVGYGYGSDGGDWLIGFHTDVELQNPTGQIIVAKQDFAEVGLRSKTPNREFRAVLIYGFSDLRAGEYRLIVTFRDQYSNKSARFTLPFVVAATQ